VTPELVIQPAKPNELPSVLGVLDDAATWLRKRGIDQWPKSFSMDSTWRIDRIRSYVEHGCTYLVRDPSGEVIATFTLSRGADPQFAHGWPGGPDRGGYLFRMAVRRGAGGNGTGAAILDWASREVARWGRPWLRIDVHRYNSDLQRYYERLGFVKVAEVTAPDLSTPGRTRGSGALMQRPTGVKESEMDKERWDPEGTAAVWLEAANLVFDMRLEKPPASEDAWNAALEQAARTLERHALEIKQENGMYYRALRGQANADG
jgi:GNAT superfamily N-acetyltransferase